MDSEFMRGAKMAYNDCADLIADMAKNLPPELDFAASGFVVIAEGIRKKLSNMEFLLSDKETKQ
jgi:hypothetical protein